MQQSMTGYGRDERTSQNLLIKSEIKTLNSKFLDLSPRLPKELSSHESEIRNIITESLKRGKVMVSIELEMADSALQEVQVDEARFKAFYEKFETMAQSVHGESANLVNLALQAPNVIKNEELDADKLPWKDIKKSLQEAISHCVDFRKNEGQTLEGKLLGYIQQIATGLEEIRKHDESRSENIRSRLQKNLEDIKERVQVDENRFEQELIYYLERLDITEEKVRLEQHLNYFREVIQNEDDAGKKLGFISQEIGREINTIGSKANHAEIQRIVVSMKDDLEKIKEQTLNIL